MYFDKLQKKRITLKEVLEKGPEYVPCIYDCLSARIMEETGFKAICFSGGSFAAAFGGVPDIGLITSTEVKTMVGNIAKVTSVPMIVDIDTGFGNELNTIRTCVDMAKAGAMAVHLEDQVFPKRCGHMGGKKVIDRDAYIRKVRAAADALRGSSCMLIARTDSYLQYGVEEAIERNKRSLEAGAHIAFTEGARSIADIERIAREVDGWNMFDMCHGGASPDIPFEDLCQMGYRLITAPIIGCGGAVYGITEYARQAYRDKNDFFASKNGSRPMRLFELMNIQEWMALGQKYDPHMAGAEETLPLDKIREVKHLC